MHACKWHPAPTIKSVLGSALQLCHQPLVGLQQVPHARVELNRRPAALWLLWRWLWRRRLRRRRGGRLLGLLRVPGILLVAVQVDLPAATRTGFRHSTRRAMTLLVRSFAFFAVRCSCHCSAGGGLPHKGTLEWHQPCTRLLPITLTHRLDRSGSRWQPPPLLVVRQSVYRILVFIWQATAWTSRLNHLRCLI
jgi:hypothetical protein